MFDIFSRGLLPKPTISALFPFSIVPAIASIPQSLAESLVIILMASCWRNLKTPGRTFPCQVSHEARPACRQHCPYFTCGGNDLEIFLDIFFCLGLSEFRNVLSLNYLFDDPIGNYKEDPFVPHAFHLSAA